MSKTDLARIQQFLRTWDPLGLLGGDDPAPVDDYDSYAPRVLAALQRGLDEDGLATVLNQLERDEFATAPNETRNRAVAATLLEWWNSGGVRRLRGQIAWDGDLPMGRSTRFRDD